MLGRAAGLGDDASNPAPPWIVALVLLAWGVGAAIAITLGHPVNLALIPMELPDGGEIASLSLLRLALLGAWLLALRWGMARCACGLQMPASTR